MKIVPLTLRENEDYTYFTYNVYDRENKVHTFEMYRPVYESLGIAGIFDIITLNPQYGATQWTDGVWDITIEDIKYGTPATLDWEGNPVEEIVEGVMRVITSIKVPEFNHTVLTTL